MRRFAFLSLPAGRLARAALLAGALALAGAIVPATQASADDPGSQTTLVSSANPSLFGQGVTLTATVSAVSPATGIPTGTVTFYDGTTQLGSPTLDSTGTASIVTGSSGVPSLAAGSHSLTVTYNGDTNFGSSTSSTVTQVVNQGHTTTTLTSSPNPSLAGHGVTLTAVVSPNSPSTGTPTGSVTFSDGGTFNFTAILVGGIASIVTGVNGVPSLAAGSHSITAAYNGDANFTTSTSTARTQIVVAPLSITTTSLPGGTYGSAYSQTLAATGGITPYTWSVSSGSLPDGLSIDSSTGTISGTPTAPGTFTFSVQVADSSTQTATQSLAITIAGVADLAVSISGPSKPVQQSKPATLTITVQNIGPFASQGVVLTDILPSGAQFASGTASQGSCTTPPVGSTGTFSCSLGTLALGATATLTLTIDPVIKNGTLSDTATASAATVDPVPANNSATAAIQVK